MATKIKFIHAKEFLEVTPAGIINIATSRQLLVDIAKAEHPPVDHELFVDFRNTQSNLSISDLYQLAKEVCKHRDTFYSKAALLVSPGINFDRAAFFEACAHNRGFRVSAFTDYEEAMRWVLIREDAPNNNVPSNKAGASDG